MKHIVVVLMTMVLAVGVAVPVSAHEGAHRDDNEPLALSSCQTEYEALYSLFVEYDLWEYVDIPEIYSSAPEHDLVHDLFATEVYQGQPAFPLYPPGLIPELTVMGGCHDYDIPIVLSAPNMSIRDAKIMSLSVWSGDTTSA